MCKIIIIFDHVLHYDYITIINPILIKPTFWTHITINIYGLTKAFILPINLNSTIILIITIHTIYLFTQID